MLARLGFDTAESEPSEVSQISKNLSHLVLNGDEVNRYDGNLNISFAGVEGESLIMAVKDMAVSSGSACTSASLEPSYVLRALGRDDELAHSSIRLTIGKYTTEDEVDYAVDLIKTSVQNYFRGQGVSPNAFFFLVSGCSFIFLFCCVCFSRFARKKVRETWNPR